MSFQKFQGSCFYSDGKMEEDHHIGLTTSWHPTAPQKLSWTMRNHPSGQQCWTSGVFYPGCFASPSDPDIYICHGGVLEDHTFNQEIQLLGWQPPIWSLAHLSHLILPVPYRGDTMSTLDRVVWSALPQATHGDCFLKRSHLSGLLWQPIIIVGSLSHFMSTALVTFNKG